MDITTVTLSRDVKKKLDKLKRYDREPLNDVLDRLLSGNPSNNSSGESLVETIEILSDPEIMASLVKSLESLKKGKTYSIDEV